MVLVLWAIRQHGVEVARTVQNSPYIYVVQHIEIADQKGKVRDRPGPQARQAAIVSNQTEAHARIAPNPLESAFQRGGKSCRQLCALLFEVIVRDAFMIADRSWS